MPFVPGVTHNASPGEMPCGGSPETPTFCVQTFPGAEAAESLVCSNLGGFALSPEPGAHLSEHSSEGTSQRAPALYFEGRFHDGTPIGFRLPLPPRVTPRGGVRAFERRAKNAYFAALDALRTGVPRPEHVSKLGRLILEVRHSGPAEVLDHLLRVCNAAATVAGGTPLVPQPESPLQSIQVTYRSARTIAENEVADLLAWPLEWLRTRGYVVSKQLEVELIAMGT
jgi:hypothetical protein